MDTSPFDNQIKQFGADSEQFRSDMQNTSFRFMEAIHAPLAEWMRVKTKGIVKGNPDAVVALGTEGVKQLKADLETLVSTVPALVTKYFNTGEVLPHKAIWPHQTAYIPPQYKTEKQLVESFIPRRKNSQVAIVEAEALAEPFSRLLGQLLPVLNKHGFKHLFDWSVGHNTEAKYQGGFQYTSEMSEILGRCADLYQRLNDANTALQQTNTEKSNKYIASQLWDNN